MKMKVWLIATLGFGLVASDTTAFGQKTTILKEQYQAKFILDPTPFPPAGANGTLSIQWQNLAGNQAGIINLQTQGLATGDYALSIIRASDGSNVFLAQFTVADSGGSGALKSANQITFPSELNPRDIAQVVVSGLDDTVLLVGDLASPEVKSKSVFHAKVPLVPGTGGPNTVGAANLTSNSGRKNTTAFGLVASGVPINSVFSLEVNGTEAGMVTSSKSGKVVVKQTAGYFILIQTVRLLDEASAEVLRVDF
ncbi:MAG: hypothetical protein QOD03_193 [Verrucomicrobiota bacterium]|jgi:hypothetical protein